MKIILLTGAPGSGKSTQGARLMKMSSQFKHLSLGDVVRDILKNPEHEITKKYQAIVASGQLLPDAVILEILKLELQKLPDDTIVLLDGYPRNEQQYADFKKSYPLADALIHLEVDVAELNQRLQNRGTHRSDDNDAAIQRRLQFYLTTTLPLLEKIKSDLNKRALTIKSNKSIPATTLEIYSKLQRIPAVHDVLKPSQETTPVTTHTVKPIWAASLASQLWQTANAYHAIDAVQASYQTQNFSFSLLGNRFYYLETSNEVRKILEARSRLGMVYQHFAIAADLKHDFVATNSRNPNLYIQEDGSLNMWKLIHEAFGFAVRRDESIIKQLIDKHLVSTFLREKRFDLDTSFDTFFCTFWSEYLFGHRVAAATYMQIREKLLTTMQYSFYRSQYKGLDPTGLSSWLFKKPVHADLAEVKTALNECIHLSTSYSFIQRFKAAIIHANKEKNLGLNEQTINQIVADNVFDLILEPDFLENVMYETLVEAVKENANLSDSEVSRSLYAKARDRAYLFPIRSRILEEDVTLADGTQLTKGSMVYLNLKRAKLYHSAGPRYCVGIAYTQYFKKHLFDRLSAIEFVVKDVRMPPERIAISGNDNVPISPERWHITWRLRRDEAMKHLSWHDHKGLKFFDVLSLHEHPHLNSLMIKQLQLKIQKYIEQNNLTRDQVVILSPEVRGLLIAAQLADRCYLPIEVARKKGGYKMAEQDVFIEGYEKGYGQEDYLELPKKLAAKLAGKHVILIDDGIASGNSALACCRLIDKFRPSNAELPKVGLVLALLQHDYKTMMPELGKLTKVKTLFDCRGGPVKPATRPADISKEMVADLARVFGVPANEAQAFANEVYRVFFARNVADRKDITPHETTRVELEGLISYKETHAQEMGIKKISLAQLDSNRQALFALISTLKQADFINKLESSFKILVTSKVQLKRDVASVMCFILLRGLGMHKLTFAELEQRVTGRKLVIDGQPEQPIGEDSSIACAKKRVSQLQNPEFDLVVTLESFFDAPVAASSFAYDACVLGLGVKKKNTNTITEDDVHSLISPRIALPAQYLNQAIADSKSNHTNQGCSVTAGKQLKKAFNKINDAEWQMPVTLHYEDGVIQGMSRRGQMIRGLLDSFAALHTDDIEKLGLSGIADAVIEAITAANISPIELGLGANKICDLGLFGKIDFTNDKAPVLMENRNSLSI